jgi:hypothetical protein
LHEQKAIPLMCAAAAVRLANLPMNPAVYGSTGDGTAVALIDIFVRQVKGADKIVWSG